jgi:aminopeptidase
MQDPRIEQYARLLVEQCVGVQPGWQVLVRSGPLARPLVEELSRQIGRLGAYALQRISLTGSTLGDLPWLEAAPEELLAKAAPIDVHAFGSADALIVVEAPENTRETSAVPPERLAQFSAGRRP